MRILLSPNVYLAVRAEDLVILDIAQGEYFLLPGAGVGLTVSNDSKEVSGVPLELTSALGGMRRRSRRRVILGLFRPPIPPRASSLDGL